MIKALQSFIFFALCISMLLCGWGCRDVGFSRYSKYSGGSKHKSSTFYNRRLARITVYWAKGKGSDYYTRRFKSATGVRLRKGHCAVDPHVIPYGSWVNIRGVGRFLAVDTGSAVKQRKAAVRSAKNRRQRHAIVVDLFFPTRREAERALKWLPAYTDVAWH